MFLVWIWFDDVLLDFSDKLDHDSYLPVFFEDLHRDPRNAVSRLSQFLGIDIDREVLDSDCWSKKLETQSTYINFSSVNGDKVYGFDKARVDYWVDKLPKWQLALAEFLCGSLMTEIGYLKSGEYAEYDLEEGLNILRSNVFLQKCYEEYQLQGVGTNKLPLDPYLPENWASRSNPRAKFIDTPDYEQFLREFKFWVV